MYKEVFGGVLPAKPKPYRLELCITSVFLAWLLIRDKVINKFGLCKDLEYTTILHLLEEVLPTAYLQYTFFRNGNMPDYLQNMQHMAIIFIIFKRRHYDKATLSMLSDLTYQMKNNMQYVNTKSKWLALFTERKVEIWHSVLRNAVRNYFDGDIIQETARAMGSQGLASNFEQTWTPTYKRGISNTNWKGIVGKTAKFLVSCIKKIASNLGKAKN